MLPVLLTLLQSYLCAPTALRRSGVGRKPEFARMGSVSRLPSSVPNAAGASYAQINKPNPNRLRQQTLFSRAMESESQSQAQSAISADANIAAAEEEEREADQDLTEAISKAHPTKNEMTLEDVGTDLYNEWILQFVNTVTVKVSNSPLNDLKLWLWKKAAGDYNRERIEIRINALLDSAPMVVFGASYSPFTKKSLAILEEMNARYKFVPMNGQGGNGTPMRAYLAEKTGRTSLPSIWIGDKFIGGCYDGPVGGIASMNRADLEKLLKENNVL